MNGTADGTTRALDFLVPGVADDNDDVATLRVSLCLHVNFGHERTGGVNHP